MSRPLTLHVSALNDAEFTTYTSSIHDIVDYNPKHAYPDYDNLTVGVREARAWLRGRHPTIPPHTLDSILRLFCPDLGPADVVTGGQLFAVLRLVSHVLGGKDVDPSLVFIQAHPDDLASRSPSPIGKQPRPQPNAHTQLTQPTQPTPDPPTPDHNPFFTTHQTTQHTVPPAISPVSAPAASARPPPPSVPPKPNNPFLNRRGSQDAPPQSAPASTAIFPGLRPSASASQDGKTPPLPPRKPPILPPPRHASIGAQHAQPSREVPPVPALPTRSVSTNNPNVLIQQSLQATRIAQSLKKAEQRLEQERVMEVLKSSSSGAVNAGSMRRVRSRSPVKESTGWGPGPGPSSASTSSQSAQSAASSAERPSLHKRVPSLPPRRNLSPPASTTGTARSFEQVATAKLSLFKRSAVPSDPPPPPPPARRFASQNNSPSRTPPRPLAELPPEPPPLHPDRRPSVAALTDPDRPVSSTTPSPRVVRSKSMHQPSPPPVPPPPRRKRPESVQLTPTSQAGDSPFANPAPPASSASTPSNLTLSRHLSLSATPRERQRELDRERGRSARDRSRESAFAPDGAIGSLQKTFTSLQLRAQPALDAARYKAEGAFSRRGFVQHGAHGPRWMRGEGEARLMDDVDDDVDADPDASAAKAGRGGAKGDEAGGLAVDGRRAWGGEVVDDESSLDHDPGEDSENERERVEERARKWREGGVDVAVVDDGARPRMVLQRDDMKWPVGDGWRPL